MTTITEDRCGIGQELTLRSAVAPKSVRPDDGSAVYRSTLRGNERAEKGLVGMRTKGEGALVSMPRFCHRSYVR